MAGSISMDEGRSANHIEKGEADEPLPVKPMTIRRRRTDDTPDAGAAMNSENNRPGQPRSEDMPVSRYEMDLHHKALDHRFESIESKLDAVVSRVTAEAEIIRHQNDALRADIRASFAEFKVMGERSIGIAEKGVAIAEATRHSQNILGVWAGVVAAVLIGVVAIMVALIIGFGGRMDAMMERIEAHSVQLLVLTQRIDGLASGLRSEPANRPPGGADRPAVPDPPAVPPDGTAPGPQ